MGSIKKPLNMHGSFSTNSPVMRATVSSLMKCLWIKPKLIGLDEDQEFGEVTITSICECTSNPNTPENECLEGCELDVVVDAVALVIGIVPIPSSSIGTVASRFVDSLPSPIRS
mmetsp:Transcript_9286/g.9040  ORF Transcript_9286/g.9040 Transcript_9286/m.9040 type:complete len:114 (+) Transcript_9286:356-697(+)